MNHETNDDHGLAALGLSEGVRPLTDSERLDFLQWLTTRTDYQNQKRPTESVGSDMHLGSGRSSLYVRDLFGNIVPGGAGYSEDVRDTIDAVASVLRPNVRAEPDPTARGNT